MKQINTSILKYVFGVVSVLLLLGTLELILRITIESPMVESIYYNNLFKKVKEGDREYYKTTVNSGKNIVFPVEKNKDSFRIFIMGGSVAERIPVASLTTRLNYIIPDKNFEIINCGIGGQGSRYVRLMFKEIKKYKPDLLLILSGNNEDYYPHAIQLNETHPPIISKTLVFLNNLWTYNILKKRLNVPYNLKKASTLELIKSGKICTKYFSTNLNKIVNSAKKKGIPVFLCTIPVNFKYPPAAFHEDFWDIFRDPDGFKAKIQLDTGDYTSALNSFNKIKNKYSNNPYLHFYLGNTYEHLAYYKNALHEYKKAIALDIPGFRCNSFRNDIIREICGQGYATIIDFENTITGLTSTGITDFTQFSDNCHFSPLLYDILIQQISHNFQNNYALKNVLDIKNDTNVTTNIQKHIIPEKDYNYFMDLFSAFIFGEIQHGNSYPDPDSLLWIYHWHPEIIEKAIYSKEEIKKIHYARRFATENNIILDSHWAKLLFSIGEMYRILKRYDKAVSLYNMAEDIGDMEDEVKLLILLYRGIAFYLAGNTEKAHIDFKKVIKIDNIFSWLNDFQL